MELARVGHPLVDQDQAGVVGVEQLAQDITGARGLLIIGTQALEGLRATKLPGQLAPQRAHHRAIGLFNWVAGRDFVADQHHAPGGWQCGCPGVLHHAVDARQLARGCPREEMVKREHRVRLAAAEVGLELHDRVTPLPRKALDRASQQALQTVGEIGTTEKLDRVLILVRPLTQVHLPQVGGELGLLVAATGHVPVRRHDLAPGLQVACCRTFDGRAGAPAPFAAGLLVEDGAPQLHLDLADVIRLGGRHRRQQTLGGVEGAIGIIAREGLLVRPAIAYIAQLAYQRAFSLAERLPKDIVPSVPHQAEEYRHVPGRKWSVGIEPLTGDKTLRLDKRLLFRDSVKLNSPN